MGNLITRFKQDPDEVESAGNLTDYEIQSSMKKNNRKRKSGNSQSDNSSSKITKLDTTSYVYDKLFMKGEGSDFSVIALGERWKLHKLYLKQCSYFEALLDGVWKDSGDEVLHLEINDENVTIEGLNAVFGSLYNNEILLDVENIGGILAAAFLVGLDSVIDRCSEMMSEGMTMHNVINFYQIAERYALLKVREKFSQVFGNKFLPFYEMSQDTERNE
ncbi:unnamed protein product [Caenorhabditis auriculariae]|uniref:BTB domain-containing protein n=1 Tax=Caenorhabditis auriculariae TaxID=2777116 RepID=A0A8S1HHT9_9PELO|nr:unnamed protein product [Caenorhabditis auriculariae]